MFSTFQLVTMAVWLIIIFKLTFISSTLLHKYVNYNKKSVFYKYDDKLMYVREFTEFVFILLMCLLIIYVFHPRKDHMQYMTDEIKMLIYLFGWIILITADWGSFANLLSNKKQKNITLHTLHT